jgi:hypothetical protein
MQHSGLPGGVVPSLRNIPADWNPNYEAAKTSKLASTLILPHTSSQFMSFRSE